MKKSRHQNTYYYKTGKAGRKVYFCFYQHKLKHNRLKIADETLVIFLGCGKYPGEIVNIIQLIAKYGGEKRRHRPQASLPGFYKCILLFFQVINAVCNAFGRPSPAGFPRFAAFFSRRPPDCGILIKAAILICTAVLDDKGTAAAKFIQINSSLRIYYCLKILN